MSADFEFDDSQWQSLLKKINTKWKDIKDRKTFGALVASVSYQDIIEHFEDETGPDGPWKKRKEPYKTWIEKQGHTKILQVTGHLRKSFVIASPKFRTDSSGVLVFNNTSYAQRHDEGTDGMPKRSFMWLSKKGLQKLVDQTIKWLAE